MSYEDAPKFSDGPVKTADYIRSAFLAGREGETVHGIVAYTPDKRIAAIEEVGAQDSSEFELFETIERLARDNNSTNILMFVQHSNGQDEPCLADAEMLDLANEHFEDRGIDVMACLGVGSNGAKFVVPMADEKRFDDPADYLKRKANEAKLLLKALNAAVNDPRQLDAITQETYDDLTQNLNSIIGFLERGEQPPVEMLERTLELTDIAQGRLLAAGFAPADMGPLGPREKVVRTESINLGFVDEMPEELKNALRAIGIPEEMLNPQAGKRLQVNPELQRGRQQASAAEPFKLPEINPPKKRPLGKPFDYEN